MEIEFGPTKSAKNAKDRGLPFELTTKLDRSAAYPIEDQRGDYGEARFRAFAPMSGRLHVVCYCIRGEARRIVSFRKPKKREERAYEKARDEAADAAPDR